MLQEYRSINYRNTQGLVNETSRERDAGDVNWAPGDIIWNKMFDDMGRVVKLNALGIVIWVFDDRASGLLNSKVVGIMWPG